VLYVENGQLLTQAGAFRDHFTRIVGRSPQAYPAAFHPF
jgi:hypothetical protein